MFTIKSFTTFVAKRPRGELFTLLCLILYFSFRFSTGMLISGFLIILAIFVYAVIVPEVDFTDKVISIRDPIGIGLSILILLSGLASIIFGYYRLANERGKQRKIY